MWESHPPRALIGYLPAPWGFLSFFARAALDLVAFGVFPCRVVDAGLLYSLRDSGCLDRNVVLSNIWTQAVVDYLF